MHEIPDDDVPKDWKQTDFQFSLQRPNITFTDDADRMLAANSSGKSVGKEFKWIAAEDFDTDGVFYNLHNNSEAFTGYNGSSIWSQIYNENLLKVRFSVPSADDKILYRLVSGVHANVNMHISYFYSLPTSNEFYKNYTMYYDRVGFSRERIENIYFVYHFILSALNKIKENAENFDYSKFNSTENNQIIEKINFLFESLSKSSFAPINEENLFSTVSASEFAKEVQPVFYNITYLIH